jgi:beta-glucosidase/6-phospho-beta-glucosidase/beta-galactosidase
MFSPSLFKSYFLGGFECSTHRRRDGRRLDLLAATRHDRLAAQDYQQLADFGIRSVRDGLRWHLIEASAGRYDWSSFLPMLHASRDTDVQIIWDLCHYGWPDDIDIWSPEFVDRLARFAGAATAVIREEAGAAPIFCPVNEISYWSWAGGDVGLFNPGTEGRGAELKAQLVRASIAAIEAIWDVEPRARIVHIDPVIHVVADLARPQDGPAAESYRTAMFQGWDMLSGRLMPELGGRPEYLDIVGVNYYSDNQWNMGDSERKRIEAERRERGRKLGQHEERTADGEKSLGGRTLEFGNDRYRPFSRILLDVHERYQRPLFVAETGAEGSARAAWLHYIADETRDAIALGVPVEGICIYPILNYAGWENERACETGVMGGLDEHGRRRIYRPLADEILRQHAIFEELFGNRQGTRGAVVR